MSAERGPSGGGVATLSRAGGISGGAERGITMSIGQSAGRRDSGVGKGLSRFAEFRPSTPQGIEYKPKNHAVSMARKDFDTRFGTPFQAEHIGRTEIGKQFQKRTELRTRPFTSYDAAASNNIRSRAEKPFSIKTKFLEKPRRTFDQQTIKLSKSENFRQPYKFDKQHIQLARPAEKQGLGDKKTVVFDSQKIRLSESNKQPFFRYSGKSEGRIQNLLLELNNSARDSGVTRTSFPRMTENQRESQPMLPREIQKINLKPKENAIKQLHQKADQQQIQRVVDAYVNAGIIVNRQDAQRRVDQILREKEERKNPKQEQLALSLPSLIPAMPTETQALEGHVQTLVNQRGLEYAQKILRIQGKEMPVEQIFRIAMKQQGGLSTPEKSLIKPTEFTFRSQRIETKTESATNTDKLKNKKFSEQTILLNKDKEQKEDEVQDKPIICFIEDLTKIMKDKDTRVAMKEQGIIGKYVSKEKSDENQKKIVLGLVSKMTDENKGSHGKDTEICAECLNLANKNKLKLRVARK